MDLWISFSLFTDLNQDSRSSHLHMDLNDLYICSESTNSNFMKISSDKIIQVDFRPFLTQAQLESGFETNWFKSDHLEELLKLLQPLLLSCNEGTVDNESKKKSPSKDCILTGSTIRVACLLKKQSTQNICLLTHFHNRKRTGVSLHTEKVVAYICPRASSRSTHLTQLVANNETSKSSQDQDLSKYFRIK
ncbi:uncharacterized protein LOC106065043 isoform X2 [Biomphalaria glabrata]|uniref:Uncharacterized protein LOC106065043 isoform X2 n=1 Tax=Biomphalaria glabrata TaxID=6526 RepID=A0A9W2ZW92_BIOGL|nr:uncharacterized protein LOC106065043 isoform X2 [Biomphalaria glabrata]